MRAALAADVGVTIEELAKDFEQARAVERRLKSLSLSGPRDKLVTYSHARRSRWSARAAFRQCLSLTLG